MKPTRKNRCARTIIRDFLFGLAVFATVFTLALLDSRTSHSAPANLSTPVAVAQMVGPVPVKAATGMSGFRVSENGVSDFEGSDFILPRSDSGVLVRKNGPNAFPAVKQNRVLPGSGTDAESASSNSKLVMKIGNRDTGRPAVPGTPAAADRTWMLTIMALIFAAMTALTLALWRHLRYSVVPRRRDRRV